LPLKKRRAETSSSFVKDTFYGSVNAATEFTSCAVRKFARLAEDDCDLDVNYAVYYQQTEQTRGAEFCASKKPSEITAESDRDVQKTDG
jgi:hypothetical protein